MAGGHTRGKKIVSTCVQSRCTTNNVSKDLHDNRTLNGNEEGTAILKAIERLSNAVMSVKKDVACVKNDVYVVKRELNSKMDKQRVNIIFILPKTTNYIPVVWVRLIAFTKLRHPQKGTRQVN